jgi:acyl transferase domain-containing protein/3-hydroxymyristoyl/3-hydroxydecanoyl-(acyl carrier protein) dehydratase
VRPVDPVAVVGAAGLFPGASDLEALWGNVLARRDAARPAPPGRWAVEPSELLATKPPPPGRLVSPRACLLDDFDLGPARGLLDRPTGSLDPLSRLVLRVGVEAWRSCVCAPIDRRRVQVAIANIALPTETGAALTGAVLGRPFAQWTGDEAAGLGGDPLNRWVTGLPAGLLARALGLGGGAFTLDAACASSLYSLHLACEELRSGRADAVLAGGVCRPDTLYTQVGFSQLRALSPSGCCRPFDRRGDGLVVGEGAGIFVLKRLADALAHGDAIHGLIRGVGLSNDVRGSLLAPDSDGQQRAMRQAFERAGWEPEQVDYVECHGTGTPTGDRVELTSLAAVYGDAPLVLGSAKANVGHLLTAAAAAGFARTLLAMRHRTLPPAANFDPEHGLEELRESPFEVLTEPRSWQDRGGPRRAAVSAFGFGGINGHLLVEEWRGQEAPAIQVAVGGAPPPEPVAIVGMAAHFGQLETLAAFERAVLAGTAALRSRPADRWKGLAPWLGAQGAARTPGAWIDRLELPVGRFRLPPNELASLLPQQLLMLQVAADAADDCRVPWVEGDGRLRAGAVIGLGLDLEATGFGLGWTLRAAARERLLARGLTGEALEQAVDAVEAAAGPELDPARTVGALGGIVASRVARELRLGGPSFALSSEDASGLRSLEVAVRMLRRGEVDAMIAGAVDLAGDVRSWLATDAVRPWSRSGTPRPFDARSDGAVVGEGAAAIVLKRLSDARRDGDRVYAVVRGVGAGARWADALGRAWREAGIDPRKASLIEGHGAARADEDRAEVNALRELLGPAERPRCALTATRSIVGDAGAASGMASLVAASLALHRRRLPAVAGYEQPVEGLGGEHSPLHVPIAAQAWLRDRAEGSRVAGVSCASVDGNRMHAVLEEAEPADGQELESVVGVAGPRPAGLFAFESSERDALRALADEAGVTDVEELALRWYARRGGKGSRAVAAATPDELRRLLEQDAPPAERIDGALAWVFPGSGAHYPGMGRALLRDFPAVAQTLDARTGRLASQLAVDAFAPWRSDWREGTEAAEEALAGQTRRVIFGQVAHGITVGSVLASLGVSPDAVIGYSLGESAGLFASGAWTDRDLMFDRLLRSPLFVDQLAGRCTVAGQAWGVDAPDWVAVVVPRAADVVRPLLSGTVRLLIVNAPGECVLGGSRSEVLALTRRLGCGAAPPLSGVPTVHSDLVDPVADAYRALHVQPTTAPPGVRYYSGHLGRGYALTADAAADSIVGNATRGLDFHKTIEQAWQDGVRVFVECGPQATCTRMVGRILQGRPHLALSVCHKGFDGTLALLGGLARLIEAGVPVDLAPLYGPDSGVWRAPQSAPRPGVTIQVGGPRIEAPPLPPSPSSAPIDRRPSPSAQLPLGSPLPPSFPPSPTAPLAAAEATARAHGAFLEVAARSRELAVRAALMMQAAAGLEPTLPPRRPATARPFAPTSPAPAPTSLHSAPQAAAPLFDRDACMEFATGSIGAVLGATYAEADHHPTRVRLPDEPLMLVDRVLSIAGEPGSMGSGRIVTEHDVLPGAWYLDGQRAPVCVSVEAGQADLLLSAWLGVDLRTKGLRVYRLLDAEVVFWRDLPRPGETVRYEIGIDRFIRQGSTWLFFFRFEGYVGDEHLISMREGCAGFFSEEQLNDGRGLVEEDPPEAGERLAGSAPFASLVPFEPCALDPSQVAALRTGELEQAFGSAFAGRSLAPPLRLPGGRMELIHRVVTLDPSGGAWGLGRVEAEADVDPEAWYLTCHFVDDRVMPGTLMYEGCLHTLRVLLLRLGWVVDAAQDDVHYGPLPGQPSALRCRGQVIDTTSVLRYRLDVRELGYKPEPYVLADAVMYADDRPIVRFRNVSWQLVGLDEATIRDGWSAAATLPTAYGPEHILAFADGDPSGCFGPSWSRFDDGRRVARLPRSPLCFLDRVSSVDARQNALEPGGWTVCAWDVDAEAWFFAAAKSRSIPFVVLLEAALQPCGWLAAFSGAPLQGDGLYFRNLDGRATLHREPRRHIGTLTTRLRLAEVSRAGGMILQAFDLEVHDAEGLLYEAWTRFGFFPPDSMAAQVGIRDAAKRRWLPDGPLSGLPLRVTGPADPDAAAAVGPPSHEALTLPAPALMMLDRVDGWLPTGGPAGLGWLRGSLDVDPTAWFFRAHFKGDPVIPGSLGLQSFLQLLQVAALRRWPELAGSHRFEPIAVGRPHEWSYRGQITPANSRVETEAWIDAVEPGDAPVIVASGFLLADGRPIYEMRGFALRLVPVEEP